MRGKLIMGWDFNIFRSKIKSLYFIPGARHNEGRPATKCPSSQSARVVQRASRGDLVIGGVSGCGESRRRDGGEWHVDDESGYRFHGTYSNGDESRERETAIG